MSEQFLKAFQDLEVNLETPKEGDFYSQFSLAQYLSKFTGYVLRLVELEQEIPELKEVSCFDVILNEKTLKSSLVCIIQNIKQLGYNDNLIKRFKRVYTEEFLRILIKTPLSKQIQVDSIISLLVQDLVLIYKSKYEYNFSPYLNFVTDFIIQLLTESSTQKLKPYLTFIRYLVKRTSVINTQVNIADSLSIDYQQLSAQQNQVSQLFKQQSETNLLRLENDQQRMSIQQYESQRDKQNKSEQYRNQYMSGIKECDSYSNQLRLDLFDIYFAKKSFYDLIRKHIPNLPLINVAQLMQKFESLRFAYFKDLYFLDESSNLLIFQRLKSFIESNKLLRQYFTLTDRDKQIKQFLDLLLDCMIGEGLLSEFVLKSSEILSKKLDLFLVSTLEQGFSAYLPIKAINTSLHKEIQHKFMHLKRRARLSPSFVLAFYSIEDTLLLLKNWNSLMKLHHQQNIAQDEKTIQQHLLFLEFNMVCSFSDFDASSVLDLSFGMQLDHISQQQLQFWFRGLNRVFYTSNLNSSEVKQALICLQKASSLTL